MAKSRQRKLRRQRPRAQLKPLIQDENAVPDHKANMIRANEISSEVPKGIRLSIGSVDLLSQSKGNSHLLKTLPMIQAKKIKDDGISTPISKKAKKLRNGSAKMMINKATVIILPDGATDKADMRNKAETSINITPYTFPDYRKKNGRITKFVGPKQPRLKFTIQTIYGPDVTAESTSAYGRGTTEEDKKSGNTSLGFHEGQHGLDFIKYIRSHPFPKFGVKKGDPVEIFDEAKNAFKDAIDAYLNNIDGASKKQTDCVGNKADICIDHSSEH